ncbi:MAG: hypothetical protein ACK2UU_12305, partial [Anaerolineae bacterium]
MDRYFFDEVTEVTIFSKSDMALSVRAQVLSEYPLDDGHEAGYHQGGGYEPCRQAADQQPSSPGLGPLGV